ncbi:MAG: phage tail terminator family protein [Acetivibrio ethanolgignens]
MTLEELYKAINAKMQKIREYAGFEGVSVENEDNDDKIKRPSIRVLIEDYTSERVNFCGIIHTASPGIYYFSKNEDFSNEENIKMQEILEELFIDGVEIGLAAIEPERLEFKKEPGMLYCKLSNMKHTIYAAEETGEPMEDVKLDMEGE